MRPNRNLSLSRIIQFSIRLKDVGELPTTLNNKLSVRKADFFRPIIFQKRDFTVELLRILLNEFLDICKRHDRNRLLLICMFLRAVLFVQPAQNFDLPLFIPKNFIKLVLCNINCYRIRFRIINRFQELLKALRICKMLFLFNSFELRIELFADCAGDHPVAISFMKHLLTCQSELIVHMSCAPLYKTHDNVLLWPNYIPIISDSQFESAPWLRKFCINKFQILESKPLQEKTSSSV